jgi:hypothetical protein
MALDECKVFIRQLNSIVSFHSIQLYVPLFSINYIQGLRVQTANFYNLNDARILESLDPCVLSDVVVLVFDIDIELKLGREAIYWVFSAGLVRCLHSGPSPRHRKY